MLTHEERQNVFNKVAAHLLSMKEQSVDADGSCMYRGGNNQRCAVGVLIPDEIYDPLIENHDIASLWGMARVSAFDEPLNKFILDNLEDDLLFYLQGVHDAYASWSDDGFAGHRKLAHIAGLYNLDFEGEENV